MAETEAYSTSSEGKRKGKNKIFDSNYCSLLNCLLNNGCTGQRPLNLLERGRKRGRKNESGRVGEGGWWKRVREDKNRGISER